MPSPFQFETARLILRPFEDQDRAPFATMNADPNVMRFFASTFTPEKSNEHIARYHRQLQRDGFSFCVAEHRQTGDFLGVIGMQTMYVLVPNLPQPAVELGWRLTTKAHGYGYATEGARVFVDYAFQQLHLPGIVAITTPDNLPSRNVMHKLGMTHRPELTFDHPLVAPGHPHRQHVLYSLELAQPCA
jgi:RimJ/RimL family protein N-acetyltransferase